MKKIPYVTDQNNPAIKEYVEAVKKGMKSQEPENMWDWEEGFNLMWGEAPTGSLKFQKGNIVKAFIRELLEKKDQEIAVFMEGFMASYCVHHKLNSEDCEFCGRAKV